MAYYPLSKPDAGAYTICPLATVSCVSMLLSWAANRPHSPVPRYCPEASLPSHSPVRSSSQKCATLAIMPAANVSKHTSSNSKSSSTVVSLLGRFQYSNLTAHCPLPLRVTLGTGNSRKFPFSTLIYSGRLRGCVAVGSDSKTVRGISGLVDTETSGYCQC